MTAPNKGYKVSITYRVWGRKGQSTRRIRTGRVMQTMPSNLGYNVQIKRGLFTYWHAIDHNRNTLSLHGPPDLSKVF